MAVAVPTSISGYVSLLAEPEPELQSQALQHLNQWVDQFWMEIADSATLVEMLYEDDKFQQKELAALVLSKVYFHLGEYDEALSFALGAGDLLNLSAKTEFVETIISKCVDKYIEIQTLVHDVVVIGDDVSVVYGDEAPKLDPRLEHVVDRMFDRCIEDKDYKQALGVAIEGRRPDTIKRILKLSKDRSLLDYVFHNAMNYVRQIKWRDEILQIVVTMQREQAEPDYFAICTCLLHLNDATATANELLELLKKGDDNYLVALQIAFDLVSSATQEFLDTIQLRLPRSESEPEIHLPYAESQPRPSNGEPESSSKTAEVKPADIAQLRKILSGEITIAMNLDFLFRSNKTDILILNRIRDSLESRNSIFHSAVTFANAFMHAGTTIDIFIRENLEWLSRAANWSKFNATAALGVIHRGHLSQGMRLLAPYLPGSSATSSSSYTEGGSLFALGLIFANHGHAVMDYLVTQLQEPRNDEVVQHGAALGLGVAALATEEANIMEALRQKLFNDDAVAGEACGIAMGLTMLGSANEDAIQEMLRYSKDTQHEKIIRGLAIGVAFLMYGKEDIADSLISTLLDEQEPILRFGGAYTIALAYCGTGNNAAIKKLLQVASADPSDDVRRVAVLALGFVLFRNYEAVPRMVELLSESYNPHVRYGAALALGIACAGTGLQEAIDLLEPMQKDPSDYVRQAVLIAMSMILIQQNEQSSPSVAAFRQTLEKVYTNRHEDALAKFGATLAQGILDAGGRNVTISLQNSNGATNMEAVVGITLFTYLWTWHPLAHMLCLAFTPTAVIGLNADLKIPKVEFVSNAKPSLFTYPPSTAPKQDKTVEKVDTAVLSTTLKAQLRAKKTEKEKAEKEGGELMDMDTAPQDDAEKMETDEVEPAAAEDSEASKDKKAKRKSRKEEEPNFEILSNLSRVVPAQVKYISFPESSRYRPLKKVTGGVLILKDLKPGEEEELIEMKVPIEAPAVAQSVDGEADPPAPFEYTNWDT